MDQEERGKFGSLRWVNPPSGAQESIALDQHTIIGNGSHCNVRLYASEKWNKPFSQALIETRFNKVYIYHLNTDPEMNTQVNGVAIPYKECKELNEGDSIQLGNSSLKFVFQKSNETVELDKKKRETIAPGVTSSFGSVSAVMKNLGKSRPSVPPGLRMLAQEKTQILTPSSKSDKEMNEAPLSENILDSTSGSDTFSRNECTPTKSNTESKQVDSVVAIESNLNADTSFDKTTTVTETFQDQDEKMAETSSSKITQKILSLSSSFDVTATPESQRKPGRHAIVFKIEQDGSVSSSNNENVIRVEEQLNNDITQSEVSDINHKSPICEPCREEEHPEPESTDVEYVIESSEQSDTRTEVKSADMFSESTTTQVNRKLDTLNSTSYSLETENTVNSDNVSTPQVSSQSEDSLPNVCHQKSSDNAEAITTSIQSSVVSLKEKVTKASELSPNDSILEKDYASKVTTEKLPDIKIKETIQSEEETNKLTEITVTFPKVAEYETPQKFNDNLCTTIATQPSPLVISNSKFEKVNDNIMEVTKTSFNESASEIQQQTLKSDIATLQNTKSEVISSAQDTTLTPDKSTDIPVAKVAIPEVSTENKEETLIPAKSPSTQTADQIPEKIDYDHTDFSKSSFEKESENVDQVSERTESSHVKNESQSPQKIDISDNVAIVVPSVSIENEKEEEEKLIKTAELPVNQIEHETPKKIINDVVTTTSRSNKNESIVTEIEMVSSTQDTKKIENLNVALITTPKLSSRRAEKLTLLGNTAPELRKSQIHRTKVDSSFTSQVKKTCVSRALVTPKVLNQDKKLQQSSAKSVRNDKKAEEFTAETLKVENKKEVDEVTVITAPSPEQDADQTPQNIDDKCKEKILNPEKQVDSEKEEENIVKLIETSPKQTERLSQKICETSILEVIPKISITSEKEATEIAQISKPLPEQSATEIISISEPLPHPSAAAIVSISEPLPEQSTTEIVSISEPLPEQSAPEIVSMSESLPDQFATEIVNISEPLPEQSAAEIVSISEPLPEQSTAEIVSISESSLKIFATEITKISEPLPEQSASGITKISEASLDQSAADLTKTCESSFTESTAEATNMTESSPEETESSENIIDSRTVIVAKISVENDIKTIDATEINEPPLNQNITPQKINDDVRMTILTPNVAAQCEKDQEEIIQVTKSSHHQVVEIVPQNTASDGTTTIPTLPVHMEKTVENANVGEEEPAEMTGTITVFSNVALCKTLGKTIDHHEVKVSSVKIGIENVVETDNLQQTAELSPEQSEILIFPQKSDAGDIAAPEVLVESEQESNVTIEIMKSPVQIINESATKISDDRSAMIETPKSPTQTKYEDNKVSPIESSFDQAALKMGKDLADKSLTPKLSGRSFKKLEMLNKTAPELRTSRTRRSEAETTPQATMKTRISRALMTPVLSHLDTKIRRGSSVRNENKINTKAVEVDASQNAVTDILVSSSPLSVPKLLLQSVQSDETLESGTLTAKQSTDISEMRRPRKPKLVSEEGETQKQRKAARGKLIEASLLNEPILTDTESTCSKNRSSKIEKLEELSSDLTEKAEISTRRGKKTPKDKQTDNLNKLKDENEVELKEAPHISSARGRRGAKLRQTENEDTPINIKIHTKAELHVSPQEVAKDVRTDDKNEPDTSVTRVRRGARRQQNVHQATPNKTKEEVFDVSSARRRRGQRVKNEIANDALKDSEVVIKEQSHISPARKRKAASRSQTVIQDTTVSKPGTESDVTPLMARRGGRRKQNVSQDTPKEDHYKTSPVTRRKTAVRKQNVLQDTPKDMKAADTKKKFHESPQNTTPTQVFMIDTTTESASRGRRAAARKQIINQMTPIIIKTDAKKEPRVSPLKEKRRGKQKQNEIQDTLKDSMIYSKNQKPVASPNRDRRATKRKQIVEAEALNISVVGTQEEDPHVSPIRGKKSAKIKQRKTQNTPKHVVTTTEDEHRINVQNVPRDAIAEFMESPHVSPVRGRRGTKRRQEVINDSTSTIEPDLSQGSERNALKDTHSGRPKRGQKVSLLTNSDFNECTQSKEEESTTPSVALHANPKRGRQTKMLEDNKNDAIATNEDEVNVPTLKTVTKRRQPRLIKDKTDSSFKQSSPPVQRVTRSTRNK